MSNLLAPLQVSILAMGVIFLVLGILIWVIRIMVHFLPYTAPPVPAPRARAPHAAPPVSSEEEDHIAAIHAVLAHHLGKTPHEIQIGRITSL